MNAKAAGKVYPEAPFVVDPERVAAFRTLFDGAGGVPATYMTVAESSVLPEIVADPDLGLDFSRVLHGKQEYVYARPLEERESLSVRSRIESIREMGGNGFLVLVTELIEAGGAVVSTARSTLIERADS